MKEEQASFRYQWENVYTETDIDIKKERKEFVRTSGIQPGWVRGKKALDMGSGAGRLSLVLDDMGAEVTSVDFVDACLMSIRRKSGRIRTVRSDFDSLPFRKGDFDLIICVGVLMCTPSPRKNFMKLVPLLRKGGLMHIMVYEKYNPLRLWLTHGLRRSMARMPYEKRMRMCEKIAGLNSSAVLRNLAKLFIDVPHTARSAYDRYSNQYHSHHTEREVVGWFRDAGFDEIRVTSPITNTNPLSWFIKGKHRGVLFVTGRLRD